MSFSPFTAFASYKYYINKVYILLIAFFYFVAYITTIITLLEELRPASSILITLIYSLSFAFLNLLVSTVVINP